MGGVRCSIEIVIGKPEWRYSSGSCSAVNAKEIKDPTMGALVSPE